MALDAGDPTTCRLRPTSVGFGPRPGAGGAGFSWANPTYTGWTARHCVGPPGIRLYPRCRSDWDAALKQTSRRFRATRGTVIAVIDPTVTRRAVACAPGTMLLAIGAGRGPFSSTWRESHFENVSRADEM